MTQDLERIRHRTVEESAALAVQARRIIRPGRALPPGKTLDDVVSGKWLGKETDGEILDALEELS